MADATEIANLAAALTGSEMRITSLDEDRHIARTLKAVWTLQRRATLRDGQWNTAMRRFELAALSSQQIAALGISIYPYAYAYREPSESLRLIEVLNTGARDSYQNEGELILCDVAGPLYVRCVVDLPEPALWDEMMAEAFACRLAWKVGARIAGSAYDTDAGWRAYEKAIAKAKGVDALENPPIEAEDADWIEARWGFAG